MAPRIPCQQCRRPSAHPICPKCLKRFAARHRKPAIVREESLPERERILRRATRRAMAGGA